MKRQIIHTLFTIIVLFVSIASQAAKVSPEPITVVQPDKALLTVYGHGDEHLSWYTTADGVILVHEGCSYYVAAIDQSGNLLATTQLAHERGERTLREDALVKAQDRTLFYNSLQRNRQVALTRSIPIGTFNPPYFPHTGSPKALVILVQFKDTVFSMSNPRQSFSDYLNAEGPLSNYGNMESRNYGSVRQYFKDMSQGKFTPQFDVAGPVTLDSASAYYGKNSGSITDVHVSDMVREACAAVNNEVNFADYDSDHDGLVDLVYIIYAGWSESVGGNSSDCIWPKSSWIYNLSFDNVNIRRYGINNELNYFPNKKFTSNPEITRRINGIGLFCHEFSHTMGLPDFYYPDAPDNQEMEYWDLMDNGEYTDNGYTPTPYTPWEKEVMGWTSLQTITEAKRYTLANDSALKVEAENGEYMILHNVQKTGWNKAQLGHGMVVYRVDYPYDTVNMSDNPNKTFGTPAMTLVPADSLLISSYNVDNVKYTSQDYFNSLAADPYPGTTNMTEITSVKLNKSTLNKPIYNITETDGIIAFDFLERNPATGIALQSANGNGQKIEKIYTIDGRYVGTSMAGLPKGIYIKGNKKIIVR